MKILHVGWGFQPFRRGGLIEYAEDLMEIQVKKGYEVFYFCTGRFTLLAAKPFLKTWTSNKGYKVFELWNPSIVSGLDFGMAKPEADITEPVTEDFFKKVVNEVNPEIIHVQEFLGISTSLIKWIKAQGIKIIFTVEDYFVLCPTLKLVRRDGRLCNIKDESLGTYCADCCQYAPVNNFKYRLSSVMPQLFNNNTWSILRNVKSAVYKIAGKDNESNIAKRDNLKIEQYNKRRQFNLTAIKEIDLVIAMSNRVTAIFNYYQPFDNITTLHLTLNHLDEIIPRRMVPSANKIVFGLINAMGTVLKGKQLLLDLFAQIARSPLKDRVQFQILGDILREDELKLQQYPFVNYAGRYSVKRLNHLLDELKIDVGIVPSLWEEAYGYVGVEFLAKGIPVIGNNIGGIPDYVKAKETGWLNESCTSDEMFSIINYIVNHPDEIISVNENLVTNRSKYVKTMEAHFYEMDAIYQNLLQGAASELTKSLELK